MSTILYQCAPDMYRGDLDCIKVLTPHDLKLVADDSDNPTGPHFSHNVLIDGEPVAVVHTWLGSGGCGRIAAEEIEAIPPHTIKCVCEGCGRFVEGRCER